MPGIQPLNDREMVSPDGRDACDAVQRIAVRQAIMAPVATTTNPGPGSPSTVPAGGD